MAESEWMEVSLPGQPWRVRVQVAMVDESQRIVGLELTPLDDPPPTGAVVSSLSLRSFPIGVANDAVAAELARRAELELSPPEYRKPFPREHYELVATAYEIAAEAGLPPVKFVAEYFCKSRATAKKYVAEARLRGLIEPAEGRTAGAARRGIGRRSEPCPPPA